MDARPTDAPSPRSELARYALALLLFSAVAFGLYSGALRGGPVTDDALYLSHNPYVRDLDAPRLLELLDPRGSPAMYVTNYSPVTLLAHAGALALFGEHWLGHHVVNLVLHALVSVLLVALLRRHGVGETGAWLAGVLFLVHPANVEAVAWMSQLKTLASLALALSALLSLPRRPALATGLFGLALLAKAQALAALPFAAIWAWQSRPLPARGDARSAGIGWGVVVAWSCVFALYAVAQFPNFSAGSAAVPPLHEDPLLNAANIAVVGLRYLAIAATSWGVAAFQQPDPIAGWASGWLAACVPVYGLLAWRLVASLRSGSSEARWWLLALASFAPISQIFPFQYPVADRYLYFLLPGLLGGALCAVEALVKTRPPWLQRAALGAALALVAVFGARTLERARIWRNPVLVLADSAQQYPDGVTAHLLRARNAAVRGDATASVDALEAARRRGFNGLSQLLADPAYAPMRGFPRFDALLRELAEEWVAHFEAQPAATQLGLKSLARSYLVLGRPERAADALDRALELGGPLDEELRAMRTRIGDPLAP